MTIVQAGALQMTVSVPEAQIRFVKVGAKGRATTTAYPESSLNVKVLSVSSIPVAPGKFEAKLSLAPYKNDENAKRIVPGLACSIRLTPYFNKEAITVPSGAVSREGQSRVVYLKGAKGKPEKREVKVGKSFDGKTEIVEGLEEGDEILLKRP